MEAWHRICASILVVAATFLAVPPALARGLGFPGGPPASHAFMPQPKSASTAGASPHLYARSEADVFFAQGFNAARDRLFQIDLWRRRGLGQLAEVFGPEFADQDAAARLFLYRGDMDREWRIYSSRNTREAEPVTQRFVEGINAYVDWLQTNPARMPWEFTFLKYQPAKWTADDVIRIRSHGLTRNLDFGSRARQYAVQGEGRRCGPGSLRPHQRLEGAGSRGARSMPARRMS